MLADPGRDCPLCPRLVSFRSTWRAAEPVLVQRSGSGLRTTGGSPPHRRPRPRLRGANRTGRPFTGDYAGDLLYETLIHFGFARGTYRADPDDGLELIDARIVNAVRCVPPENKPTTEEIRTCRPFLAAAMAQMSRLSAIVALGKIAHDSVVVTLGERMSRAPFGHGTRREIGGIRCSAAIIAPVTTPTPAY